MSYCETTHHRPGRLWQVQVRSCVSINISSCFSPESGYKSRFLPSQKCSLGPQRFLVLLLLIAQIGFDLIIFSSDIQEGQALLTARLITSTEGRSCDLSFAHGLRFFHTSPKPVLCCPIWPFPSEAVRNPSAWTLLPLAEGLLYRRTDTWMNDLGFSPVTGYQKHYSHFSLHGKTY